MKEFWNSRYKEEQYAYGKAPNAFFKQTIDGLDLKGRILLPAEGEGRNAVYAAQKGWSVDAFDISEEGKKKSDRLAASENVVIDYKVGGLFDHTFIDQSYDCAALIYAHFPPNIISDYHAKIGELILPGGILILEGFSKSHIEYQKDNPKVGGPKNIEMLFSVDQIKRDFPSFNLIQLEETEVELSEGEFHIGKASVVRFVGQKRDV